MSNEKLMVALSEFAHVGGALVIIIAVVSVITGLMREYIPQEKLQQKLTKHERWGALLGASFGMLTPFCSASVVPVSMGMATMGVSLGTVLSFLISAPLCNFVVLAMIYAVFGLKVTVVYLAITFSAAVLGGLIISKSPWRNEIKRGDELEEKNSTPTCSASASPTCTAAPAAMVAENSEMDSDQISVGGNVADAVTLTYIEPTKVHKAFRFALVLFKKIVPYVLIGALISGLSAAYLPSELVGKYVGGDSMLSILIASVIGVPLYLRIEMAIPMLKVLIVKGMGMGPAMALIIGGTGASLPEIALVSSVLKPKAVVAFVSIVLITAFVGGSVFQFLI